MHRTIWINMIEHPCTDIWCEKDIILKNKNIVLCATGGIGIVEDVKLVRELIRYGANVYPVMSKNATKILSPEALWFAAGKKPITEISGDIEHVMLCGERKNKVDLVLVSPCTANTLSKIANGICDTTVSLFVITALGSGIPVQIIPAMHITMYRNPIIKENIEKLKKLGVDIILPRFEENKAKMPDVEGIVAHAIRRLSISNLNNRKCMVISGSTNEHIDDVRAITNISTGKTGIEITKRLFMRGADVTLVYGKGEMRIPDYINTIRFYTIQDLPKILDKELASYDVVIVCAALPDYIPVRRKGKISSNRKKIELELKKSKKIINWIRERYNGYLVGFKLETNVTQKQLMEIGYRKLREYKLDLIVANDIRKYSSDKNEVIIIDKKNNCKFVRGKKSKIAEDIVNKIENDILVLNCH